MYSTFDEFYNPPRAHNPQASPVALPPPHLYTYRVYDTILLEGEGREGYPWIAFWYHDAKVSKDAR